MYLVMFLGLILVVSLAITVLHKTKIREPRDLIRKASPFDSRELLVLARVFESVQINFELDGALRKAIGGIPGLLVVCYNAGRILSAARACSEIYPDILSGEYEELRSIALQLRIEAVAALWEMALNYRKSRFPLLHTRQCAQFYGQMINSIQSQFGLCAPDLLQNLQQVL